MAPRSAEMAPRSAEMAPRSPHAPVAECDSARPLPGRPPKRPRRGHHLGPRSAGLSWKHRPARMQLVLPRMHRVLPRLQLVLPRRLHGSQGRCRPRCTSVWLPGGGRPHALQRRAEVSPDEVDETDETPHALQRRAGMSPDEIDETDETPPLEPRCTRLRALGGGPPVRAFECNSGSTSRPLARP